MTMDGLCCAHGYPNCSLCDLPPDEPEPLRRMLDSLPEPEPVQLDTPERLPSVLPAKCSRCKAAPGSDSFPCAWCSAPMCSPCWEERGACCPERLPPVFVDPGAVEWSARSPRVVTFTSATSVPSGLMGDPVPEPREDGLHEWADQAALRRIAELEAESTGLRAEYAGAAKVVAERDRYRAALERLAEASWSGGWSVANAQTIARQALAPATEPKGAPDV